VNNSGVSAQVTTDPAIITNDEQLFIRYPQSMKILRSTIDPPTAIVATVPFINSELGATFTELSDLIPATRYFYRIQTYSDTGELGVVSPSVIVDIPGPPLPASALAYASGNAATLNLTFTPSLSGGVTYHAYVQAPGTPMNWNDIYPAVYGVGTVQLAGLSNGVNVITIRADNGIEERIGTSLEIEFVAGVYIPPRPNTPSIMKYTITGGLTAAIKCSYDPSREVGVATHVHLYYKAVGGAYAGTPDATANLSSEGYSKVATPSVVLPATGWYWFKICAATAINVEDLTGIEKLIYVSDVVATSPVVDGVPTRG